MKGVKCQKKTIDGCLRRFVKRGTMVKELAKRSAKRKRKQFDKRSIIFTSYSKLLVNFVCQGSYLKLSGHGLCLEV